MADKVMEYLNRAYQQSQAGNHQEAIRICQQTLLRAPKHPKALELMAIIHHFSGQTAKGIPYLRQAILVNPHAPELYTNLGNMLHAMGQDDDAIQAFRKVISMRPNAADACLNLALLLKDRREFPEAMALCQQALAYFPGAAEVYNTLGILHQEQYQFREAEQAYREALRLKPDFAFALNNLGTVFFKLARFPEALDCYQKAVAAQPDYAVANYNHALALMEDGKLNDAIPGHYEVRTREAIPYLEKALALQPEYADACNALGSAYKQLRQPEEAMAFFRKAITYSPRDFGGYTNLSKMLMDQGDSEEAREIYRQAYAAMPEVKLWGLAAETMCPAFFNTVEEMEAYREQTLKVLDDYADAALNIKLDDYTLIDCRPSFFLSYQGMNDLPIKNKFGDLLMKNLKEHPLMPTQRPVLSGGEKPRVAFMLTKGHEGLFCKFTGGLVSHLSREKFDISIICPPEMNATIAKQVNTQGTAFFPLQHHLETDIQALRAAGFDMIFYFEIGTDTHNYMLPFFRLAPVQVTSWAIPVTSGIPEVDYYLSTSMVETPESPNYFREKLVNLETLPIYFERPKVPEVLKSRTELGLPEDNNLYFCAQTFNKMHPDYDDVLTSLYQRDPNGRLVFIQRKQEFFTEKFLARLEAKAPGISQHMIFMSWMPQEDFLNSVAVSDVVLDTMHYGGGTSFYDCLSTGTPIITLPSQYHRGRVGMALYQKMGVTDCIVADKQQYVDLALKLTSDKAYNQSIRERILAENHKIYEEKAAVEQFEQFLMNVTRPAALPV